MLATGAEQNGHQKDDDGAAADPPREFHQRQPRRLLIKFCAEDMRDVVRQTAYACYDHKTDDHRNDIPGVVAALFRENSTKEDSQKRAVGVTKNSENNRNNTQMGSHDHEVGSDRCDNDDEN